MTMMQVVAGETRTVSVDFANLLGSGDSLSGTPAVTLDPSGEATAASAAISGDAVTFTVSGVVQGRRYRVKVQCGTTNSETLIEQEATIAGL